MYGCVPIECLCLHFHCIFQLLLIIIRIGILYVCLIFQNLKRTSQVFVLEH